MAARRKSKPAPVAVPAPARPPDPPKHLGKVAAAEWRRAGGELHELGVLTSGALAMLETYCQTFAEIRELDAWIAEHGRTIVIKERTGEIKYIQQVPQVSIRNKARSDLKAQATSLGLTPSSRAKLGIKAKKKSPAERMAEMRSQLGKAAG